MKTIQWENCKVQEEPSAYTERDPQFEKRSAVHPKGFVYPVAPCGVTSLVPGHRVWQEEGECWTA